VSTIDLTIIAPYYNDEKFLTLFFKDFLVLKKTYPNFKLIIVDDGSNIWPAEDVYYNLGIKIPDFTLYVITKDLGFNAHGARNLGVTQSTSEWNFITDIDHRLINFDFENIIKFDLSKIKNVWGFSFSNHHANTILIHKETFLSFKGYDEEFVNNHYGDKIVLYYIKEKFNYTHLVDIKYKPPRDGRRYISQVGNLKKTTYPDDDTLMQPKIDEALFTEQKLFVINRYATGNFSNKKILNFEWKKCQL
jgi:glycosyltransferase involved in cell wall biosynthesis